ncbi:CRE-BATH-38 protein [Aphelenchoides avenae]|nr:CRE-BATH-38 protein [Aphelenchus avenae]
MTRQITLTFVDSGRAVATCCPHDDHATVADLVRCAGRLAFFSPPQDTKIDILSCEAQLLEGLNTIVEAKLTDAPRFPAYFVSLRTRKTVPPTSPPKKQPEKQEAQPAPACTDPNNKVEKKHQTRPSLADVPELPFSDVKIFVGKESVRSNSGYLSVFSTYFGNTFRSMTCDKRQMSISVSGVTSTELAGFLLAIYPNPTPVNGSNVVALARLAHRFGAASLMDGCVAFLRSDAMPVWRRIYLAGKLEKLDCMRALKAELMARMTANVRHE